MIEVSMLKNEWGQSCDLILKLTVSEQMNKWMDEINWLFACWYRFSKIKSWSKIHWVGIVRDGCCQSAHGTLKFTLSQKWTDGINWFVHAVTN